MKNIRVAIYVRVSTQEQAEEGYSIQMQTERLIKYCDAKEWIIINTYTDPGYSGSNTNRPALSQMINDIKVGAVNMVLVYKLDRLSRSQKDTLYLIEDIFLKNNVDFVSMNENFDTSTPFGRAMIGILSVFAQLEREQIKERMAMGHLGRAKDGYWRGGSGSPIGYNFLDGELIVNEYEAMQVREIFDLFINGNSIHKITEIMKSKYSNRYSSWNNHGTVGKILRNTIYIGKINFKGKEYVGQHESIISEDIFRASQLRYSEIEKSFTGSQKSAYKGKHLLSGMIFCGNCGARYFTKCTISKKSGTYYYYICYSRDGNREMKKIDGCKNSNYREDTLDKIVTTEILSLAFNPEKIDSIINRGQNSTNNKSAILENRIVEINKQVNKLMDLYQLGTIDISEISMRVNPLHVERNNLEAEIKKIYNDGKSILTVDEAKSLVVNSEDILLNGSLEEKQSFINTLISKITIFENGVEIHWKFLKF